MLRVSIDLDCNIHDQKELNKHGNALLFSTKMYDDYIESEEIFIGIGPEMFAEYWIRNNFTFCDDSFGDLMLSYFVKILKATQDQDSDDDES